MLLQDTIPFKIERKERVFTEDSHGRKQSAICIGGQFQKANTPNANGRIYPLEVLEEAVKNIQEDVKARGVLGELDHSADAKIHLDRVSHVITKLWMDGDIVYGEAEILENTQMGSILKSLIVEHNCRMGISSRGVGDMETIIHEGEEYSSVLKGFSLVGFDIVAEPSVHHSFMKVVNRKPHLAVAESTNKMASRQSKADREKQIIAEIRKTLIFP